MNRMKVIWFSLLTFLMTFPLAAEDEFVDLSAPPAREQSVWHTFVLIGIALVFFYFILWRPEQKRRKSLEEARGSLAKGSRVTAMGIIGTVSKVEENTVILKMVDGSKIEFLKAAITDVLPPEEKSDKQS